jgi:hypothetical protein
MDLDNSYMLIHFKTYVLRKNQNDLKIRTEGVDSNDMVTLISIE